jgi:hypothetical protein
MNMVKGGQLGQRLDKLEGILPLKHENIISKAGSEAGSTVGNPHHYYADRAPGKNFDAAPALGAPAPTLMYSKAKLLKRT